MDERSPAWVQLAAALGVLGLGMLFGVATLLLPEAPGYSQIGPGVVPAIVSLGLLSCGGGLLVGAARGGWRGLPKPEGGPFEARPLLWVVAGLAMHAALIGRVGFIVASTVLFVFVARGLGSTRWLLDSLAGLVLAASLYALFTQVLHLSLGPTLGLLSG